MCKRLQRYSKYSFTSLFRIGLKRVRAFLCNRCGSASGTWYIRSSEPLGGSRWLLVLILAGLFYNKTDWWGGGCTVPVWVSGLCRPDRRTAKDEDTRGGFEVDDCRNVPKVDEWVTWEGRGQEGSDYNLWIVLASFFMWYRNDASFLPGGSTSKIERLQHRMKNNMQLLKSRS